MFSSRNVSFFTVSEEIEIDYDQNIDEVFRELQKEILFGKSSPEIIDLKSSEELEEKEEKAKNPDEEPEDPEHIIFSQLKEKLEVKKETRIDCIKLEEFWDGIKFEFSKNKEDTTVDSDEHRMQFNPLELANLSAVKFGIQEVARKEIEQKELSVVEEEESIVKETSPPVNGTVRKDKIPQKEITILKSICEEFISKDEKMEDEKPIYIEAPTRTENFVSNLLVVKQEEDEKTEKACDDLLSCAANTAKFEKITKAMLDNFFQSLSDEVVAYEAEEPSPQSNISRLSESARMIRKKKTAGLTEYNKILNGIMQVDPQMKEPVKKPSPPKQTNSDEIARMIHKENVPLNHQQERQKRKILFKDQIPSTSGKTPQTSDSISVKNQPRLLSSTYDDLDKLNDRFKFERVQKSELPAKTANLNQTSYSILNTSISDGKKVTLKTTKGLASQAANDNSLRDNKLKKSKDELKSHMNINQYLNEFCRTKFTD